MISNMMVQIGNHLNSEVDVAMIRHMVLNSLRANRKKFKSDFGELVICADDKDYGDASNFLITRQCVRKHKLHLN